MLVCRQYLRLRIRLGKTGFLLLQSGVCFFVILLSLYSSHYNPLIIFLSLYYFYEILSSTCIQFRSSRPFCRALHHFYATLRVVKSSSWSLHCFLLPAGQKHRFLSPQLYSPSSLSFSGVHHLQSRTSVALTSTHLTATMILPTVSHNGEDQDDLSLPRYRDCLVSRQLSSSSDRKLSYAFQRR